LTNIISEIKCHFQGDRTKKVGVVDRQYVVHKGIQTLGGSDHGATKVSKLKKTTTVKFLIL
jgi:hypothetical protein